MTCNQKKQKQQPKSKRTLNTAATLPCHKSKAEEEASKKMLKI